MDFNKTNKNTIAENIRSMKIRGAGLIARSAANSLKQVAIDLGTNVSKTVLIEELNKECEALLDSRPTAVSLWNGV